MGFTLTQQLPATARHGWNVDGFEWLYEAGFIASDVKTELIEGEIWECISPSPSRAMCILLAQTKLIEVFFASTVRVRLPLKLGEFSKPAPDVCVVRGAIRNCLPSHPTTALLIVEISDTTLIPDQQTKAPLYARAGVAEYWIVNLVDDVVEVRREAVAVPAMPLGYGYASTQILRRGETFSPLAAPESVIRVEDLLP